METSISTIPSERWNQKWNILLQDAIVFPTFKDKNRSICYFVANWQESEEKKHYQGISRLEKGISHIEECRYHEQKNSLNVSEEMASQFEIIKEKSIIAKEIQSSKEKDGYKDS